jgi:hypothetical protein
VPPAPALHAAAHYDTHKRRHTKAHAHGRIDDNDDTIAAAGGAANQDDD